MEEANSCEGATGRMHITVHLASLTRGTVGSCFALYFLPYGPRNLLLLPACQGGTDPVFHSGPDEIYSSFKQPWHSEHLPFSSTAIWPNLVTPIES